MYDLPLLLRSSLSRSISPFNKAAYILNNTFKNSEENTIADNCKNSYLNEFTQQNYQNYRFPMNYPIRNCRHDHFHHFSSQKTNPNNYKRIYRKNRDILSIFTITSITMIILLSYIKKFLFSKKYY